MLSQMEHECFYNPGARPTHITSNIGYTIVTPRGCHINVSGIPKVVNHILQMF